MARTPFKMRSGNSTPFKKMGSSPVKQDKNIASTDITTNKKMLKRAEDVKASILSPDDLQASKDTARAGNLQYFKSVDIGPSGNISKNMAEKVEKGQKNKNITTKGKALRDATTRSVQRIKAHERAMDNWGIETAEKTIKHHTSEIKRKEGLKEAIKRGSSIAPTTEQSKRSKGTIKGATKPFFGRKV